ncbi:MAG: hypothetical protein A2W98_13650 [Bacteroidetes bacterium GWF2_33_38]|nr:MAG: hypothetical protein A2W98_13650 [Bacteroidetes bacterium GWF2_33_38]OFY74063.1 MAG: hypothetical protein A2265_02715 [Bacteroidetes bacterium RIFOXYA12_FULL_33_9]OFY85420.1 MAG: hypothetical protein A2236_06670 [Bacteroidetes bacterium RIFOXYA2_FULL_33_7]
MEWNESLSVSVDSFDMEHKELIKMINEFNSSEKSKIDKIFEILDGLIHYSDFHFKNEERFMKQSNYKFYEEHKAQHERFISTINKLKKQYIEGRPFVYTKINRLLKTWLIEHIKKCDKKYAEHLIKTYKH